jgi:D-sedoheptulose 7-phosphate isomerase
MDVKAQIVSEIEASVAVKQQLAADCAGPIAEAAAIILRRLREGSKLIVFGNGGSASDAQHIAAEFVGRYEANRQALAAIALTTNSSSLTAISNDYGFAEVFARQVQALAKSGDVALAISTSGNSENVLRGAAAARQLGAFTIGLTGRTGGKLATSVDLCICVPSDVTSRIQESHILIGHIVSKIVEGAFLESGEVAPAVRSRSRGD